MKGLRNWTLVAAAVSLSALYSCTTDIPSVTPSPVSEPKASIYSETFPRGDADAKLLARLSQPQSSPDQDKMNRAIQRLLAQNYDCPNEMTQVSERLKRPIFTKQGIYDAMTRDERTQCATEGDDRALGRINARLEQLPAALLAAGAAAADYLDQRTKMIKSQCDADLKTANDARMVYSRAASQAALTDEDFYWDSVRLGKANRLQDVRTSISDRGVTLSISGVAEGQNATSRLEITATGLPAPPAGSFEWGTMTFSLNDPYGPGSLRVAQTAAIVTAPDIGLDPLPIQTIAIDESWERDWEWNVSEGHYGKTWSVPSGYNYCTHSINVWSDNNVCKNSISTSNTGLGINAVLKSGSFVDRWRGWLRFRGTMTAIRADATDCQRSRAQCRPYGGSSQFVEEDGICQGESSGGVEELCEREGPPGREMCHFGVVNAEGRCQITKIVPCY